ncbi:MAG: DUF4198 domain-containing protein [Myxococcales bacterium]|nr:DUF4198 domain-containing protein [Myxococcota bacterium]MDW8280075.1 DUF4198 domain-containing protein [Myxococcales bacterium]
MRMAAPCLLACLLASPPAGAHDKWIEAEPFRLPAPGRVKLYLATGDGLRDAELRPLRRRAAVSRLQLHSSAGKRDLLAALREDQQPIAVLEEGRVPAGTLIVALDAAPIDIELTASRFESYLFAERLFDVLAQRARGDREDAPVRERYSRCLKAVLQVGDRLDKLAQKPVGQELEIVPQQHPYGLTPSTTLTVQVLFRGKPLAGRALSCANRFRSALASRTVRTDGSGKATCPVSRGGDWMLSLVHMEPGKEEGVDWRSYWASLTFALPE